MTLPSTAAGVEKFSAVIRDTVVHIERIEDSKYVLAHSDDADLVYGGLVSEDGIEFCQVMVGEQAARLNPDTMELEYVDA